MRARRPRCPRWVADRTLLPRGDRHEDWGSCPHYRHCRPPRSTLRRQARAATDRKQWASGVRALTASRLSKARPGEVTPPTLPGHRFGPAGTSEQVKICQVDESICQVATDVNVINDSHITAVTSEETDFETDVKPYGLGYVEAMSGSGTNLSGVTYDARPFEGGVELNSVFPKTAPLTDGTRVDLVGSGFGPTNSNDDVVVFCPMPFANRIPTDLGHNV